MSGRVGSALEKRRDLCLGQRTTSPEDLKDGGSDRLAGESEDSVRETGTEFG